MVLHPEHEAAARAIFEKWELDFATIGKTTNDLRFRVLWQGEEVANLPIKDLGDEAPEYDRHWVDKPSTTALSVDDVPHADIADALLKVLGSPACASRRWVYEQYDTLVQGNTVRRPGGDAGLVRVDGHPTKALAFSSDVTPRYCEADPYEGGKQAVAECYRNLIASGADPLAATDNLNFGNPERPETMGQLVRAVEGIGEACRVLDFPIVSGNVSLYNETNGEGILPTPTIGGVGLVPDWQTTPRIGFAAHGELVLLIGGPPSHGTHLGQSLYLREVHGREDGLPPFVDLAHEKRVGAFVLKLIRDGVATAVHDVSDGGIALALAEMALAAGFGATITELEDIDPVLQFFGEDQGRYILTIRNIAQTDAFEALLREAGAAGVRISWIGRTGGDDLILGKARPLPITTLRETHEGWFPAFMGAA